MVLVRFAAAAHFWSDANLLLTNSLAKLKFRERGETRLSARLDVAVSLANRVNTRSSWEAE
jgi:hypothetical protein